MVQAEGSSLHGTISGNSGVSYEIDPSDGFGASLYWSANYVRKGYVYCLKVGFTFSEEDGRYLGGYYPVDECSCAEGCFVRCQKE